MGKKILDYGNATALTLTPTAGGTHAVSATLTILRVQ